MNHVNEDKIIEQVRRRGNTKGSRRIRAFLQELIRDKGFLSHIQTIRTRHSVQIVKQNPGTRSLPPFYNPNSEQTLGVVRDLEELIKKYDLEKICIPTLKDNPYHDFKSWLLSFTMTGNITPISSQKISIGDVCFLSNIFDGYCHKCGDTFDKKYISLYYPIQIHIGVDAGSREIKSFIDAIYKTEIEPMQVKFGKQKRRKPRTKPKQSFNDLVYTAHEAGQSAAEIRLMLKDYNIHKTHEEIRRYITIERKRREKN